MGCSSGKTSTQGSSTKTSTEAAKSKTLIDPETQAKAAKPQPEPEVPVKVNVVELLDDIFNRLDKNGDGFVSKEELSSYLENVLEKSHVESQKTFKTLLAESGLNPYLGTFEELDTNHDGKISREEFQANVHPSEAAKTIEKKLKQEIFDRIDTNGDGSLSRREIIQSLNHLLECSCLASQKNFKTLMTDAGLNPDFFVYEQLDANQDDKITWEEFKAKLRPAFDLLEFLKSVFNKLDDNGDGTVSKDEFSASIERMLDCTELKSRKSFRTLMQEAGLNTELFLFEQLDTNQDGRITWEEFEASLKPAAAQPEEPAIDMLALEPPVSDQLPVGLDTAAQNDVVLEEGEASGSVRCLCGGW